MNWSFITDRLIVPWCRYFDYEHVPKKWRKKINNSRNTHTSFNDALTDSATKWSSSFESEMWNTRTHTCSIIHTLLLRTSMIRPIHTCNQFISNQSVLLGMTFSFEKQKKTIRKLQQYTHICIQTQTHTHTLAHTPTEREREREGKIHKRILKSAFVLSLHA